MESIIQENLIQWLQIAGKSGGTIYLLITVINKIYAFCLRKRPIKVTKKYSPNGKILECSEEYRH
jgi:hypothetical protein